MGEPQIHEIYIYIYYTHHFCKTLIISQYIYVFMHNAHYGSIMQSYIMVYLRELNANEDDRRDKGYMSSIGSILKILVMYLLLESILT